MGSRLPDEDQPKRPTAPAAEEPGEDQPRPGLKDLAALAFVASLAFMALEMVAGRLVAKHLGSSIYGWTSVIAVLLAGLSFGNFLGGKLADFIKSEKHASWLFLFASDDDPHVIVLETRPTGSGFRIGGSRVTRRGPCSAWRSRSPRCRYPGVTLTLSWPYRILFVVTAVFFLPAVSIVA